MKRWQLRLGIAENFRFRMLRVYQKSLNDLKGNDGTGGRDLRENRDRTNVVLEQRMEMIKPINGCYLSSAFSY